MTETWYKPKLIEVGLPLEDINKHSVRENYIYRGNPSAIHKWWAQRPLAACRAVMFAQLVDDPTAHPDKFPTEETQKAERDRLHDIISRLVVWENIHDENLLKQAHEEILASTNGNPPPILEPFAGGGTIPVEAQRLGLEVYASDLNPVAVLINKALTEIPPKWAECKPIFPNAASSAGHWPRLTGLAEDVRCYGKWMHHEAEKRIGHLYPKIKISGVDATVLSWIWARTVTCPNPACGGTAPLIKSFWMGKKKGKERYLIPIRNGKRIDFDIGGPDGVPRKGTIAGRSGAVCLICDTPISMRYIQAEGVAGRMGAQLTAIVAEGDRQRYYVPANRDHELIADVPRPIDIPEMELSAHPQYMGTHRYGVTSIADLFTNRQLTALATFSDLVGEVRNRIIADGGEPAYSDAIATYLSFVVSKVADYNCTGAVWYPKEDRPKNLFARQAIPMIWDYPEINTLADIGGTWAGCLRVVTEAMDGLLAAPIAPAHVQQAHAGTLQIPTNVVTCTDPPYYDNVPYADLSDFFYAWLRRSLRSSYPDLLSTMTTPKSDELVADNMRHGGKWKAERFFEDGFRKVFTNICEVTPNDFPITVFYAFKQSESVHDGDHASTGWETLLEGMIQAGWAVTATWPVRTERAARIRDIEANALASSIVLACRPRSADANFTDRRGLIQALREELPGALKTLEQGKVAPVDLRQAAIGPGMAVFSRYSRVNEPDGQPMRVRAALSLINQILEEKLSQPIGDVNADTRFCVEWFKQFGFDSGRFGTADVLARGVDTAVSGLERAGVLTSRAGKVKLLSVHELPDEYDPATGDRTSEWEICLHLVKALQNRGTDSAARLMASARDVAGIDLDDVKELSYLLYSIAEKKGWAETALLFNNLGTSWTDIEDVSRKAAASSGRGQGEFTLEFGSDDDGDE